MSLATRQDGEHLTCCSEATVRTRQEASSSKTQRSFVQAISLSVKSPCAALAARDEHPESFCRAVRGKPEPTLFSFRAQLTR
jgi:hypothetical protein